MPAGSGCPWGVEDQKGEKAEQENAILQGEGRLENKENGDGQDDEPGLSHAGSPCAGEQQRKDG